MVIGVDGCAGGWLAVALERGSAPAMTEHRLVASARELWDSYRGAELILIDIPIGLAEKPGGRRCDVEARRMLGRPRMTSVFSPPCREALAAADYRGACAANLDRMGTQLSKQAFNLFGKIREVDELMRNDGAARSVIRESHPEVCFLAFAGRPMRNNKKTADGRTERSVALEAFMPNVRAMLETIMDGRRRADLLPDDAVDALVLACTALGSPDDLHSLPTEPERDACGLPMEIVYRRAARS